MNSRVQSGHFIRKSGIRDQGSGISFHVPVNRRSPPLRAIAGPFSPAGAGSYSYCRILIVGCARCAGNGGLSENPGWHGPAHAGVRDFHAWMWLADLVHPGSFINNQLSGFSLLLRVGPVTGAGSCNDCPVFIVSCPLPAK